MVPGIFCCSGVVGVDVAQSLDRAVPAAFGNFRGERNRSPFLEGVPVLSFACFPVPVPYLRWLF